MTKIKKLYNLVRAEEYFSKKENKNKNKWYPLGTMTEFESGKIIIKLNHINGSVHAFEMKGYTKEDKKTYQKNEE